MLPPAAVAAVAVGVSMALEARRSAANEAHLFAAGGLLVGDPDYPVMRVTYPVGFVLMCLEGWGRGAAWDGCAAAGVTVFLAGKAVKYAAIRALGVRWSFRVIRLPGAPLVSRGIYRFLRHPNYVGVVGELLGVALWMRAPIAGTLFAVTFGWILWRRIRLEERALGLAPRA